MIGDKIAQSVTTKRNLPHASALSALLMLGVFMPLLLTMFARKMSRRGRMKEESQTSNVLKGAME
jgi:ABC-type spermidine/putrescine transport system permease subunit I